MFIFTFRFTIHLILSVFIACLFSCGGDEEVSSEKVEDDKPPSTQAVTEEKNEVLPDSSDDELVIDEPEKKIIPNPNGVYLPTEEEKNGKPVFENQEGFSLWFDSQNWKITDKIGGGKTISLGKESINSKWQNGAKARFYPDEEYAKDATFRLAVAFHGSEDNKNAIRLFEQFVMDYPDDKLVAEAYLSLGDLSISEVGPDEQPSFEQISKARKITKWFGLNRIVSAVSDATSMREAYSNGLRKTPKAWLIIITSSTRTRMRVCKKTNSPIPT